MDKINEKKNFNLMLSDPTLLRNKAYIGGEWIASKSGKTFSVLNPATLEVITDLPDLGEEEARFAIAAAYKAQGMWSSKTGKERAEVLQKFFKLMCDNADDLAKILTAEMGKPIAEARGEIIYGASFLEFFAEEAKRIYGETIPGHQSDKKL